MDERNFHSWLRKNGRTEEVADRVIRLVTEWADFLNTEYQKQLEAGLPEELDGFVASLEQREPQPKGEHYQQRAKSYLWAIRYYYQFTQSQQMEKYASMLRQARIKRSPFKLKEFRGVDSKAVSALEAAGIKNINQMLKRGKTPKMREEIAAATGISTEKILELVKLSDLARIPGVKTIRARLYHDAGVDTVEKMAGWNTDPLYVFMAEFVERTGFDGTAPLRGEVLFTINTAKALPRVVEFE